jgi:hypothetical protein
MKTLTLSVVVFGALAFAAGAQAAPAFNTDDCRSARRPIAGAPSELLKEGWTLKYRSQSSPQLMDVYWIHEIWIRKRTALTCSHVGGRTAIRVNERQTLDEVDR